VVLVLWLRLGLGCDNAVEQFWPRRGLNWADVTANLKASRGIPQASALIGF